eukprot:scaffold473_cov257-Pinguiococcus_pyrenoidosus.AAC.5
MHDGAALPQQATGRAITDGHGRPPDRLLRRRHEEARLFHLALVLLLHHEHHVVCRVVVHRKGRATSREEGVHLLDASLVDDASAAKEHDLVEQIEHLRGRLVDLHEVR